MNKMAHNNKENAKIMAEEFSKPLTVMHQILFKNKYKYCRRNKTKYHNKQSKKKHYLFGQYC